MTRIKILFLPIWLLMFSQSVFAEQFLYTCISDKNWMINFQINTKKETVFFISSGSTTGGDSRQVKEYENVLEFTKNRISVYDPYSGSVSYRTFFLDKNVMLNSAHYPNKNFHNQIFNCIRG